MRHPWLRPLLLSLPLLFIACRDTKVASYRIPKEQDKPATEIATATPPAGMPGVGDMSGTAVAKADGADLTWTAPARWQSKPASAMRKATFAVSGDNGATAELSVTAFPGTVGGELANVNRWRDQLGLPAVTDADLPTAVTRLEANGLKIAVVDLLGTLADKPTRMLGAMVPNNGAIWFFKFTGEPALVANEKPAFLAFLQSLKADATAAPAPMASLPTATPSAPPAADMASATVSKAEGADLKWIAPANWHSVPPTSMRKATYTVAGDGGTTAELVVTAFPGTVGGELANVNRWRDQLGLSPVTDAALPSAITRLDANGLHVALVDLTGSAAGNPTQMLGAMVPSGGATWFFKFTGSPTLLAQEKPAFLTFLKSLQAP